MIQAGQDHRSSPSAAGPVLELAQVTKRFGSRLAVDELTLAVPAGEIFGLLGHNGAGKSTAIGMLLGQVWPTAGTLRIFGHDVAADRRNALKWVGAIFESPAFYDYLSGYRNLEILSHYTAPTPRERLHEVIEWVGLSGREQTKVRTYSHGMRARLALAQALLPQPKLLILDEPSDGLDPEGIHEIRQTILRLHRELGMTIFLSSHLLNEVEQLCTRIAVLRQGRKLFEGTLAQAKNRHSLVRLRTSDFEAAARRLSRDGLITDHRDGQLLLLAPGATTSQVVRNLVEGHLPVHEIAPEELTLEGFYLELMKSAASDKDRPGETAQTADLGASDSAVGAKANAKDKLMDSEPDQGFKIEDFVPSLAEVVKANGLDSGNLTAPCPDPSSLKPGESLPRELIILSDGKQIAQWKTPSLRALFRGSQAPPADIAHYPPEYVPLFYSIERHALNLCDVHGDKTDGEFEEWYSNLRRRPDGRSLGPEHDQLWRALALLLAQRPTSQAEYEAVVGQLAASVRHFRQGHASRNYLEYLRAGLD